MPTCAFKRCKNYSAKVKKDDGMSYFNFPRNELRREMWRKILVQDRGDNFYKPNKASAICIDHFNKDDIYTTSKGLKRLRKTAVPVLKQEDPDVLIVYDDQSPCTSPSSNFQPEESKILYMEIKYEENDSPCISKNIYRSQITSSPASSVTTDSILETPLEAAVKKELEHCKKRLITKIKMVKNLQKVNNRLKKKNATLKSVIADLKKQRNSYKSALDNLPSHIKVKNLK